MTDQTTGAASAPSSYLTPEVLDKTETARRVLMNRAHVSAHKTEDSFTVRQAFWHLMDTTPALIAAARRTGEAEGKCDALNRLLVSQRDLAFLRIDEMKAERDAAVARAEAVEKALRDLAPYHQGGKSPAGQIIADALGVPFPLRPPSKSGDPS